MPILKVVAASFEKTDSTLDLMALMKKYFKSKGIPLSFYVDAAPHFKTSERQSTRVNIKGDYGPTLE